MFVRKGEKKDIPSLLHLIRELALYERAPGEVVVTEEELERDGFGEEPVFKFFVAEKDAKIIGIALYYVKYSTWKGRCIFLEDIIVSEEYRNMGAGRQLFEAVVGAAKTMDVKRLEWQVLEWNQPAIDFYKKFGAAFDPEWINCKLTGDQIRQMLN